VNLITNIVLEQGNSLLSLSLRRFDEHLIGIKRRNSAETQKHRNFVEKKFRTHKQNCEQAKGVIRLNFENYESEPSVVFGDAQSAVGGVQ
jgi:hypothetical protein